MKILGTEVTHRQIALVLLDFSAVLISFHAAVLIRFGVEGGGGYLVWNAYAGFIICAIYLVTFYICGMYAARPEFERRLEALQTLGVSTLASCFTVFLFYLARDPGHGIGRGVWLANYIVVSILLVAGRSLAWSSTLGKNLLRRTVIAGHGKSALECLQLIREHGFHAVEVVAILDTEMAEVRSARGGTDPDLSGRRKTGGWGKARVPSDSGVPVIHPEEFPSATMNVEVDQLVLADFNFQDTALAHNILSTCLRKNIEIIDPVHLYEQLCGQVPIFMTDYRWFLQNTISRGSFYVRRVKYLLDKMLALLALILTAPLFLLIAICIKLDSPGRVFYRQEREGLDGVPFSIRKFRTMIENAEDPGKPVFVDQNLHKLTRFGRILRRARLDELPQFINVLQGEMSVVGPRPERPAFGKEFERLFPFYELRLTMRPGITGWAQIWHSYSSNSEQIRTRLQYDLYYVRNVSFLLDCSILLHTLRVILLGKGK